MLNKTFRSLKTNSRRNVSELRNTNGALLISLLVATLAMFAAATVALAEDWPQFRGVNGSGVSASTGLPEVFGPDKSLQTSAILIQAWRKGNDAAEATHPTLRAISLCAAAFLVALVEGLTFAFGGSVYVHRRAHFADAALVG